MVLAKTLTFVDLQKIMNDSSSSAKAAAAARPALKEGEWACVDAKCAHINSATRRQCQKCGKGSGFFHRCKKPKLFIPLLDKPRAKQKVGKEIGKEAAEKSKGLFSAEDWVCTKFELFRNKYRYETDNTP